MPIKNGVIAKIRGRMMRVSLDQNVPLECVVGEYRNIVGARFNMYNYTPRYLTKNNILFIDNVASQCSSVQSFQAIVSTPGVL